jgi:hypothetical protein
MPVLSQYWFGSEFFGGKFNGWNEPTQSGRSTAISGFPPFSGPDSSSAATLVRERPDDEIVLDIGATINGNQAALNTIDGLLTSEAKRTSPVFAAGVPWGPRIPYYNTNPTRHELWEMIVRIYFNVHISTPWYCWDLDGTISYYLMFFLDTHGMLKAVVDADGWSLGWKAADVCRDTVRDKLSTGVDGGVPTVQGLLDFAIAQNASGRMTEIYLLPGSGTKKVGAFQEDADTDVALVVRPFHINPALLTTVARGIGA